MLKITYKLILVKESNNKDHKFQVGDHVRISKYVLWKTIAKINSRRIYDSKSNSGKI